jgi:hypothetical protein
VSTLFSNRLNVLHMVDAEYTSKEKIGKIGNFESCLSHYYGMCGNKNLCSFESN